MRRKAFAETERPGLVKALAASVAAASLLFIAEGVLVGWFLSRFSPSVDPFVLNVPWTRLPQYLAVACLAMIGAAGLLAAAALPGGSTPASYFAVAIVTGIFVTGAVFLSYGIRIDVALSTWMGVANLGLGLLTSVLLGLSWYTLDPLGLHGEPG
jgi:hypothetical protein